MNYSIVDIETDGLYHQEGDGIPATKIYCLSAISYINGEVKRQTFTSYSDMEKFIDVQECIIGHEIIKFDVPVMEKFLKVRIIGKIRLIDTLGLSQYLYPNRLKHGLEYWGDDVGIEKPEVTDWFHSSIETYIHRCQTDCRINDALWTLEWAYLLRIYNDDENAALRLIRYLSFKLDCAREQGEFKWKLDEPKARANLEKLKLISDEKKEILAEIMPKVTKFRAVARPKVLYKKDMSLSEHGKKWMALLTEKGLPDYHVGAIKIPVSEERGNPNSHQQLKDWLVTLGWEPDVYKYAKKKDGPGYRRIPQLNTDQGEVCDSVKLIYEDVPRLEALEGFFVVRHRISLLEGFLENKNNQGYLMAQTKGFANTLRFQHSVIVNLPTMPRLYWEEVRSCLIADDDKWLCGADMTGLEDNTKQHFMYYFDPDYVKELRTPGFDPHLDIAVLAGLLSTEQAEEHKLYTHSDGKEGVSHKAIRLKSKKANYASIYGAGPPKLALVTGIPLSEAKLMHRTIWLRNHAIKEVAANAIIKTIGSQSWLFNPISRFWYSLRAEKDIFSTLNQSTGTYCFDTWVKYVRMKNIKIMAQFHDEIVFQIPKDEVYKAIVSNSLHTAIDQTNNELKLNVPLTISVAFGDNYADIH